MKAARLRFIKFTGQQFKQEEKKRDRERESARERESSGALYGDWLRNPVRRQEQSSIFILIMTRVTRIHSFKI